MNIYLYRSLFVQAYKRVDDDRGKRYELGQVILACHWLIVLILVCYWSERGGGDAGGAPGLDEAERDAREVEGEPDQGVCPLHPGGAPHLRHASSTPIQSPSGTESLTSLSNYFC